MQAAHVSWTSFFDDWKRFCFVLREIASGENGRPLSSLEAQKRAQAVLTERGPNRGASRFRASSADFAIWALSGREAMSCGRARWSNERLTKRLI